MKVRFKPKADRASVVMGGNGVGAWFRQETRHQDLPSKQPSWASVRDKLVNGEVDAAHARYGLVYGVHLGVGGAGNPMAVLMTGKNDGQAITLSKTLADKGAVDGPGPAKVIMVPPLQSSNRTALMATRFSLSRRHGTVPSGAAGSTALPPAQKTRHRKPPDSAA